MKPGSYRIRPSRDDAEQNPEDFYSWLESVRSSPHLKLSKLADITGDATNNPEVNLSKKISARTLQPKDRKLIVRHAFEDAEVFSGRVRTQLSMIDDAPYFALLNFFRARETSQDKARARALGIYRFWRPSVEHDDEYVFGKIEFSEDPTTMAVHAQMTQTIRHPDGTPGAGEHYRGYLFRFAHMYCMLLRDQKTSDPRISLFPTWKIDHVGVGVNPKSMFAGRSLHVVYMDGYSLGVDGERPFFSPLYLSLEDDVERLASLDDELDILCEGHPKLPSRVVKKLKRNGPLRRL